MITRKNDNSLSVFHNRGCRALVLSIVVISISPVCVPQKSFAVLGSDWHIETPGGNAIYGGDRCLGQSSACLTDGKASMIYAHHLRRWRYYFDYIIGEQEEGFFIFHEPSGTFQHFEEKTDWKDACEPILMWLPLSAWITRDHGFLGLGWLSRIYGNFGTLWIGICAELWLIYALIRQIAAKEHDSPSTGITMMASLHLLIEGVLLALIPLTLASIFMLFLMAFFFAMTIVCLSALAVLGGVGILFEKKWGWWAGACYLSLMIGLYIFISPIRIFFMMELDPFMTEGTLIYEVLFINHVLLAAHFLRGPLIEYSQINSMKPLTRSRILLALLAVSVIGVPTIFFLFTNAVIVLLLLPVIIILSSFIFRFLTT